MTDAARTLASKEGLALFLAILDAQEAWRTMTKIQRTAVAARLCDCTPTRTMAALERRGIAREGALTEWGEFVRSTNQPNGSA